MNTTPHKHSTVIKAYADGLAIQVMGPGDWIDADPKVFRFSEEVVLRIKPIRNTMHAECIDAFAKGAEIQYRKDETAQWTDTQDPNWHEDFEYRVKPEPAVPVYPETLMSDGYIEQAYHVDGMQTCHVKGARKLANAAIARAIDDGQVMRVDDTANKAFDKRMDLAEAALLDAGYERVDVEGNWKHKSALYSVKIDTNGYISGTAMKLGLSDTSFSSTLPKEPDELARRACRALCEYLGKSRDDVSFEVIQAIILLERNKP